MAREPLSPNVVWSQRPNQLLISINVAGSNNNVNISEKGTYSLEEDKLTFKGTSENDQKDFAVELEFFKKIDPEKSNYVVRDGCVNFVLEKKEAGHSWDRLLKTSVKQHWLKWEESDDDDSDNVKGDFEETHKKGPDMVLGINEMLNKLGMLEGTEMKVKGDLQCNGQRCGDNVPLWEDESLKKNDSLVICTTCKNDEDEQNYVYHPHCSEAFHNKKKNKNHDFSDIKTAELKGLSEAQRKLVLNCTENVVAIVGSSGVNASVGAIVAGAARAASRYGTGVLNMADEVGRIGANLSPGAAVGIGAGVSGALAVIEVGYYAYRWANGQMDSQEFKVNCIKAAVGNLSAFACVGIGAILGSFVPVVGSIVGGIIGGIVGAVANYASRRIVDWAFDDGEDEKRAQLILEAMYLLDTVVLKNLDAGQVKSCFRRLALTCHPDSVKIINSNEEDKAAALLQWEILKHAKDVLLAFLENKHKYSDRCKGIIVRRCNETEEPMMSFVTLQSHMVKAKTSKSGYIPYV